MEPRVRYVPTPEGTRVAYSCVGSGPPLLEMEPLPFCNFQRSWQFPEERRWFERLARTFTLVQHDPRGTGLSTREAASFTQEGVARDIDLVLDAAGVARVALVASYTSGPFAVAYAATRPERVSQLVLWATAPRVDDLWPPQLEAIIDLIERDWELFTETATHLYRGWSAGDPAHRQAAFLRECVTPQAMRAMIDAARTIDVRPLLAAVRAPTLVVHRGRLTWLPLERAQELAAGIAGARLLVHPEGDLPPFAGDLEGAARAIEDLAGVASPPPAPAAAGTGLVTIVFTDVVDSTRLTERLGDAGARDVLRVHERVVREALREHGGTEIKALGDGFLLSFSSAARALACAAAIQLATRRHAAADPAAAVRVRIGVNAGEPRAEGDDLFGTAVNLAARIAAAAPPDGVLVADVVRQLVAGKKGFAFGRRSEVTLRGFDEPVVVHELVCGEAPPS